MSFEESGLSNNHEDLVGGGIIDKAVNFSGWLEQEYYSKLSDYKDILGEMNLSEVFLNPAHSQSEDLPHALLQEFPTRLNSFKLYDGVLNGEITLDKKMQYQDRIKTFDVNIYGQNLLTQLDMYQPEEGQVDRKNQLRKIFEEIINEIRLKQAPRDS